jgi:hypothetical protein
MDTVFKAAYSLVVAILFIRFVILGQRTFYDEPSPPRFPPTSAPPNEKSIFCEPRGDCFIDNAVITAEMEASLSTAEREFLQEQREIARLQRVHKEDTEDYFRNVFIIAAAVGLAAVVGGLLLFPRVEALPLGFLVGGVGVIVYGWVESSRGPDESLGTGALFAVVGACLVAVVVAGYWLVGGRRSSEESR